MSTGTDEHGMKIQRAAEKEGVAPREDAVELHKSIIFFSVTSASKIYIASQKVS